MIDPTKVITSGWASYLDSVVPRDAHEEQISQTKRAYVAGAFIVLELLQTIAGDEFTEEQAIEAIAGARLEVDALLAELSR